MAKTPTARNASSFTRDSKAMAIMRPSWRPLTAPREVPKRMVNSVIRTQKPNARVPWDAFGERISAVSEMARICKAMSGVTPTSITSVVAVPAQGDRYLNAIRSARELNW